jgi:hypothetical protein
MRRWELVTGQSHRWAGGTFKENQLSDDEAAVYAELGTPDAIRFFRALRARQHVYEWIYEDREQVVWFVDGKRVEYVAVDTNNSGLTKETREMVWRRLVSGGALGMVIGGLATGVLLLGDDLGLKD